jgi:uncharacterized membrane protein YraQ (UPF0718 family)
VDYSTFILRFTSIVYEALPFVVLGVVLAGILEEFVPQQFIAKIIPRSRPRAIAIGGLLGLVFPMCECGIIPIMRRLLRKGLPLSVCVCYMLAGPIINVVVMTSTYVAFNTPDPKFYIFGGPENVVLLRVGLAFLIAFSTSLLVERQWRLHGYNLLSPKVLQGLPKEEEKTQEREGPKPLMQRINNITETALHDFVDIMVFLILGAFLAAVGRGFLDESNFGEVLQATPALAILGMMAIAVLFCLCSEADAFVAANFSLLLPPSSKLAFLVLGPMLDLKLYLLYTRIFRARLIWTIIPAVVIQVFIYTMIVHYAPELYGLLFGSAETASP